MQPSQDSDNGRCVLCTHRVTHDHPIRCTVSRQTRTLRHDRVVDAIMARIDSNRFPGPAEARSGTLPESGLRPDIVY